MTNTEAKIRSAVREIIREAKGWWDDGIPEHPQTVGRIENPPDYDPDIADYSFNWQSGGDFDLDKMLEEYEWVIVRSYADHVATDSFEDAYRAAMYPECEDVEVYRNGALMDEAAQFAMFPR